MYCKVSLFSYRTLDLPITYKDLKIHMASTQVITNKLAYIPEKYFRR